ncbi:MAG: NifB/NifX family molybdenum-iron cluster-binding protein, partial [Eubacteriales bacterium]
MIKIAVASENGKVTEHFGHCENFMIFDTENNQITKDETIANPGHRPGFLPSFMNDMGVNVIISGGMVLPLTTFEPSLPEINGHKKTRLNGPKPTEINKHNIKNGYLIVA